jgi:hypothetical protein
LLLLLLRLLHPWLSHCYTGAGCFPECSILHQVAIFTSTHPLPSSSAAATATAIAPIAASSSSSSGGSTGRHHADMVAAVHCHKPVQQLQLVQSNIAPILLLL